MKNNQKNKSNISFLQNKSLELIMFGGKGGVGKTTCAAATALYLSKNAPDSSFLLVSTDPAHSLMDSIGEIPSLKNLEILEFDANAYLENFKNNNNQKLHEIASRGTFLDEEDITNLLDLSLPGLDELMSFLEISRWVEEKKYSCIIVDTAPTGHTLRFLGMQDVLSKWLIALDTMLAKHRYMKKLFSGSYHADELDIFLKNLAVSLKNMKKLLQDPKLCCFVPVTIAETLATKETISLINKLQNLKIPIAEIIINRLVPVSLCPLCEYVRIQQTIGIKLIFQVFPEY
ncbi:MAG: ArsA family ATPase, partial [Candidatus Delongbacteria bacterium]|nr:ArsA family ATPase [Candidatus Delongbacteria bacterium]